MGYSGFEELLCENGHYEEREGYGGVDIKTPCSCGAKWTHWHSVDTTNGYDEDQPYSCEAPKTETGFDDVWHVDHYGNKYATKKLKYEPGDHWVVIPKELV